MNSSETILVNQVKKCSQFIQGIEKIPNSVVLDGVKFSLRDLQELATDMQLNAVYVRFDIAALKRENKELKRGFER